MDNSKSIKFKKVFLKAISLVAIGAFCINNAFVDLAWAKPNSCLRATAAGEETKLQEKILESIPHSFPIGSPATFFRILTSPAYKGKEVLLKTLIEETKKLFKEGSKKAKVGLSTDTIERDMRILRKAGLIVRENRSGEVTFRVNLEVANSEEKIQLAQMILDEEYQKGQIAKKMGDKNERDRIAGKLKREIEYIYPISNRRFQSILSEAKLSEHAAIFSSPQTSSLLQPWFRQYSEENIDPENLMKKLIMTVDLTPQIGNTKFQTAFFRYQENFKEVKKLIVKKIKEKIGKGEKQMKIWSAGCSIGAEPYSLAIMFQEIFNENKELGNISDWNIEIIATDNNLYVLNFAAKGIYHKSEIEKKEKKWGYNFSVDKYFKRIPDGRYKISNKIENMVAFEYLDLKDEKQREKMRDFDVIFCRNVYTRISAFYGKKTIVQSLLEDLSPSVKTGGLIVCSPEDSANAPLLKRFYQSLNFKKITSTIFKKETSNLATGKLQQKFSEFAKVCPDIQLLRELRKEITSALKDPDSRRAVIINHRLLREPGFALGLYKILEQLGWGKDRGLRLILSYDKAEEGETVDKFYKKIEEATGVDLSSNFFDKVVSAEEEKKPGEVINKLINELNVKSITAFGPGDWVKLYKDIEKPAALEYISGVVCKLGDNNNIVQVGTAFDTALEAFLVKEQKDIFEITESQEIAEEHKPYIKNARNITGAN